MFFNQNETCFTSFVSDSIKMSLDSSDSLSTYQLPNKDEENQTNLQSISAFDSQTVGGKAFGGSSAQVSGQVLNRERLWNQFFADPSQWLDNRRKKKGSTSPDFKHRSSNEALWIESWLNPPWVKAELAAMSKAQGHSDDFRPFGMAQEDERRMQSWCNEPNTDQIGGETSYSLTSTLDSESREGECGSNRDVRTLCKQGCLDEALQALDLLDHLDLLACSDAFVPLVQQCCELKDLKRGKHVHSLISKSGLKPSVVLLNSLVNMYAKCGSVEDALLVFNSMTVRDVISWTTILAGYLQNGDDDEALKLFQQMKMCNMEPDEVTFVCALKSCCNLVSLKEGKHIHAQIIDKGFETDIVGSTLVYMYARCGSIERARQVFDKMSERGVVPWNVMISGYAQYNYGDEALKLYQQMQHAGTKTDSVSCVSALNACAHLADLEQGICIHAQIIEWGFESGIFVGSTLIDMYSKCGDIEHAHVVFNKMPDRGVVTWNTMITGLCQNGHEKAAIELFWEMLFEGVEPNDISFTVALNACAFLATLEQGEKIHAHVLECGFESDVFVGRSLVNMYAKCGHIDQACKVFNKMGEQDAVSWTAMIAGYACNGDGKEALRLAARMHVEGIEIDDLSFVEVLTACSHAGLVGEGLHYFAFITREYGISPKAEHYAPIIDLLGRAGLLHEAMNFIRVIPGQPSADIWMALLSACRISNDVEVAEFAAEQAFRLEPQNGRAYVLLSNIYAAVGKHRHRPQLHNGQQ